MHKICQKNFKHHEMFIARHRFKQQKFKTYLLLSYVMAYKNIEKLMVNFYIQKITD